MTFSIKTKEINRSVIIRLIKGKKMVEDWARRITWRSCRFVSCLNSSIHLWRTNHKTKQTFYTNYKDTSTISTKKKLVWKYILYKIRYIKFALITRLMFDNKVVIGDCCIIGKWWLFFFFFLLLSVFSLFLWL